MAGGRAVLGERVAVLRPVEGEPDAMGVPARSWRAEEVAGCLVRPLDGSESGDAQRPDGRTAAYRVAFPKTWTAGAAPLSGCRLALVERGMDPADAAQALRVQGSPDVTRPCPTRWDLACEAVAAHG